MTLITLTLKAILDFSVFTIAKGVFFSDRKLKAVIRKRIGSPDGQILKSDLKKLYELNAEEKNIADLNGIEHCINLRKLNLNGNQISDITPLSNLTNLQKLYLGDNQIVDITPLSNLTNLQKLDLGDNQIVDITPLSNLTNLQKLYLGDNQIVDVSPLSNLINLQELYLMNNQISEIDSLVSLTEISLLFLTNNQIQDISHLVTNIDLGEGDAVDLRGNPLSDSVYNTQILILQARGMIVWIDRDYLSNSFKENLTSNIASIPKFTKIIHSKT